VEHSRADVTQDGCFAEEWDGACDQPAVSVKRAGRRRIGIGAVSHDDEFTRSGQAGAHLR